MSQTTTNGGIECAQDNCSRNRRDKADNTTIIEHNDKVLEHLEEHSDRTRERLYIRSRVEEDEMKTYQLYDMRRASEQFQYVDPMQPKYFQDSKST